jgi:hypothetical protein
LSQHQLKNGAHRNQFSGLFFSIYVLAVVPLESATVMKMFGVEVKWCLSRGSRMPKK